MKLLAFDASTEACSVALSINNQVFSEFQLCPQSHSLVLLPMIDRLLKQADHKLSQLDGIIFGQGPGSFTGVRIGTGVAQGLAFSADLPVVGVSTLQTMAQQAYMKHSIEQVIATIDARMSEVYVGYYQLNAENIMTPVLNEAVLPPTALADYLAAHTHQAYGVGTGWQAYSSILSALQTNQDTVDIVYPDALAMLAIGQVNFEQKATTAEFAQPVYVRDTVSWKKLPGR